MTTAERLIKMDNQLRQTVEPEFAREICLNGYSNFFQMQDGEECTIYSPDPSRDWIEFIPSKSKVTESTIQVDCWEYEMVYRISEAMMSVRRITDFHLIRTYTVSFTLHCKVLGNGDGNKFLQNNDPSFSYSDSNAESVQ